ncbi:MAG TPA: Clp protease N-terminal domain-containing protein, partial [Vicingus sp.]|nr:Clp protease N-terminal domain-containing protein [Vicingus sp.]
MDANFSVKVKDVITYSKEEALRLGHDYIGVEHLLLGIIREGNGLAIKILKSLGVDAKELRAKLEEATKSGEVSTNYMANIPLIKQAEKVLKITYLEAKMFKNNVIGTEHLLLSILKEENNVASKVLNQLNVTYNDVKEEIMILNLVEEDQLPKSEFPNENEDDDDGKGFMGGSGSGAGSSKSSDVKSKTPVLDNFGRDLTKYAEDGKLDPIVG